MNVPKIEKDEVMSLLYIAGLLIMVFLVFKIFRGVGLIKNKAKEQTKQEREEAAENLRGSEYFNYTILKNVPGRYFPLGEVAKTYAETLRKAVRGFGTNEEAIFTLFGRLKNKWNIAEISFAYFEKYNRDLLTDLLNDLTNKEQVVLWNIIEKLPVL